MKKSVEQKLIDAAREVFYEKGYDGATVRDIAKKAEVNLALLHYYFRTKDKLFEVVFQDALNLLFKKLNKAFTSDITVFDKIELMVSSYITTASKHPQIASFLMREFSLNREVVWEVINSQPQKKSIIDNYDKFFEELIEAGQKGIIKELDPKQLCIDILSLSLFPFMAKGFLVSFLYPDKKSGYNSMIKERTEHVSNLIISNIKK
ncbi:TetR family transcriptional regulator [Barnesiella propionica]|uniref:TetR/AcrR family transcriptional regulator n=1 Tax=Barnesiella propionica TaxID=2981781 RepID=UPI0011C7C1BE|nr:TetR family transcriptional regulator [Barnesiella propionica]MCU6770026.1 TetR family transcriptional regulator [Barnesiella propionica]